MPFYHPKDTKQIYGQMDKSLIENLTYRVHFNQTKDHKAKEGHKRLHTINEKIIPSKAAVNYLQKMLLNREIAIVSLSSVCHLKIFSAKLNGKLVHGLGAGHVRETSITLHPLYGVPYIPSSSMKGALRNWVLQAFFDGEEERLEQLAELDEKQKKVADIFIDLFGSQERRGLLQCYDSFPMKEFSLEPDVFTPHFPDYYTGNQPPADNQNPIAIPFYVVENAEFQFMFSILKRDPKNTLSNCDSKQLLELAVHWCMMMLKETGIGSKTSSGYGYFDQFQDITNERLADHLKKKQQRIEQQKQIEQAKMKELEEKRKQQELEAKLNSMTPAERLAFEIEGLSDKQQADQDRSKNELYKKVIEMAQSGETAPAQALKQYWQKINSWKVKKKTKQYEKVQEIKAILGESK